jgi:hypothetical protein
MKRRLIPGCGAGTGTAGQAFLSVGPTAFGGPPHTVTDIIE